MVVIVKLSALMLSLKILCSAMCGAIWLSVIMLTVFMLTYAQCHHAECGFAKCSSAFNIS